MNPTLSGEDIEKLARPVKDANIAFAELYPGEKSQRQPVHTVYGGAHLFKADVAEKFGKVAARALAMYGEDELTFARAVGLPGADRLPGLPNRFAGVQARLLAEEATGGESPTALSLAVYRRVLDKLDREPVEDFRVDFEDGYGVRPDAEEDQHAADAGTEMVRGYRAGSLPPFVGIRVKLLGEETRRRAIRTLDIVLTTIVKAGEQPPANFVVTLPKVVMPEQVAHVAGVLDRLEKTLGLASGVVRVELMIETPQSIINRRGESNIPYLVEAGAGRVVAAHFGTYDYTASCNITAAYQQMTHPSCNFAKHVMQVSLAGTGVWLSDGATNIMPIGPHRADEGKELTEEEREENRAAVHAAWKLHYDHVRHSLAGAYYQGWDLHPAQLPTRYAAVYAFFLEGLQAAADRLRNFIEKAGRATLAGDVFDDAATGQGLLNYFLRAINCGAITEAEAVERTGLTLDDLRTRSFMKILAGRKNG